ncbi:hypothetical protein VE02_09745 [Pseudogymnoascus sp. 03VT05]|nr:hypothetical protein VE02_09745 [Pseudogymnoascus sp. 03VT05]
MTSVELDPSDVYSTFAPSKRIVIISIASIIGLLSPLSSNLYTPAIPAIACDLGVSTDAINLTITSYLIFQGLSPSLWSSIGDGVGRRLLYLIEQDRGRGSGSGQSSGSLTSAPIITISGLIFCF